MGEKKRPYQAKLTSSFPAHARQLLLHACLVLRLLGSLVHLPRPSCDGHCIVGQCSQNHPIAGTPLILAHHNPLPGPPISGAISIAPSSSNTGKAWRRWMWWRFRGVAALGVRA